MNQKKIEQMTYEEALEELEKIVSQLESGTAELDKSISLYTRGSELKKHCEENVAPIQEEFYSLQKEKEDRKEESR